MWLSGQTVGLNWSDVSTTRGLARGNQPHSRNYNDSTAILTGTWGPDQIASAIMYTTVPVDNASTECEIRLRSTLTAHNCTGYEIFWNAAPDGNYLAMARWNGPINDFTPLGTLTGVPPINGGTLTASIKGNVITAYINGVQKMQVTDSTFTSGNPGIGFYWVNGNSGTDYQGRFGWSHFSVTDGTNTPSPTPTPTLAPTPTPTPIPTPTPCPSFNAWQSKLHSEIITNCPTPAQLRAWITSNPPIAD